MELSVLPYIMDEAPYTPAVRWARAGTLLSPSPEPRSPPFFWTDRNLKRMVSQVSQVDKNSTINHDEAFEVRIDVTHFTADEISVKLNEDNSVSVEGKHEEREDEHGVISRQFLRKFVVPEDCDVKKIDCKLSSDGVLIITSPKKADSKNVTFKTIEIHRVGPAKHGRSDENM